MDFFGPVVTVLPLPVVLVVVVVVEPPPVVTVLPLPVVLVVLVLEVSVVTEPVEEPPVEPDEVVLEVVVDPVDEDVEPPVDDPVVVLDDVPDVACPAVCEPLLSRTSARVLNWSEADWPTAIAPPTMTSATNAATRPYSVPVLPRSSRKKKLRRMMTSR